MKRGNVANTEGLQQGSATPGPQQAAGLPRGGGVGPSALPANPKGEEEGGSGEVVVPVGEGWW